MVCSKLYTLHQLVERWVGIASLPLQTKRNTTGDLEQVFLPYVLSVLARIGGNAHFSQLILNSTYNDPNPTIIAKYHKKKYGVLSDERRDAYLEIRPEGEHMVDLILVTFIFAEKLMDG